MIVAIEMLDELNLTIDGEPVGMNVKWAHKNANHESLIVEVFVFFCLFYHHNLSIVGCYNGFVSIVIKLTDRTAIEVQHQQPCCAEDGNK